MDLTIFQGGKKELVQDAAKRRVDLAKRAGVEIREVNVITRFLRLISF